MRFVLRQGQLVPKERAGPPAACSDLPAPSLHRFEAMESPVTGQMITSERQRQRDMTEHGCYDPRDLPGHTYSRGRSAQSREARNGDLDGAEARNNVWGKWDNSTVRSARPKDPT